MTTIPVAPDSTTANTGTRTGGSTVHGVLGDTDTGTYMTYDSSQFTTVTFADPTIPSGAIVKSYSYVVQGRAASLSPLPKLGTYNGFESDYREQLVTNGSLSGWIARYEVDDGYDPDGATITLVNGGPSGSSLILTELGLWITYVTKPVPTIVYPTGTLSTTNRPYVWWTNTLDVDAGPQTFWVARIFDEATYSAGGFDPASDAPVAEAAAFDAQGIWRPSESLANGTYRAYVQVGVRVNGTGLLSDWVYEEFTVDVLQPAVPGLDLTPQPEYGRTIIDLTASVGETTTTAFEVEALRGTEWVRLRTVEGDGRITGTEERVFDGEATNGTTRYRARAVHTWDVDSESFSPWVEDEATLTLDQWWISPASDLSLALACDLRSFQGFDRAARTTTLQPLGAALPVSLGETRGSETGTIVVRCSDDETLAALQAIGSVTTPVLLRPPTGHHERDRWVMLGDESVERLIDSSWADERNVSWAWTEVAEPSVDLVAWPVWPIGLLPAEDLLPATDLYPDAG